MGENGKSMEFVFSVCCFCFMEFSKLLSWLLGSLFISTCAIFFMKELYLKIYFIWIQRKRSIMHLLLALSRKQHCTLSKRNFPFSPLLLFPCFSVELVCQLFCNAKLFLAKQTKKKSFLISVEASSFSVCPATVYSGLYGCELSVDCS